jgi:Kef-type K+ transport system membrane component KefB
MLFFMFTVGLEINPRLVRQNGLVAVAVGLAGTLAPLAVGVAMVFAAPGLFTSPGGASRATVALFIGAALANSAIPVMARILHDLGLLRARFGAVVLSAAVVDDLVSWTLLTIALGAAPAAATELTSSTALGPVGIATFFPVLFVVGRAASAWFARAESRRADDFAGRIGVIAVIVLASAAAAEYIGLHAFLGPFLFGVLLTPTDDDAPQAAYDAIRRFAHGFFAPIYFVSLGLTTDFGRHFAWLPVVALLATASVSKIPAAYLGARLGGLDRRTSWAVGCGMNARGAIGIILASLGLESRVIDEPTYVALVVMAIVTSLFAGPTMKACLGPRGEV